MKTKIQSRMKRIYILLLDLTISISIAYTFSNVKMYLKFSIPVFIGSISIIVRILIDFLCMTIEEESYELEQEINLVKKEHKLKTMKSLSASAVKALNDGNTDEYKEISLILEEVSR